MSNDQLAHWLLTDGPAAQDLRTAWQGLIERLESEGTPLLRVALNVDMLHPELLAAMYTWQRGDKLVRRSDTPHGIQSTGMYQGSPFRVLNDGATFIRRRLTGPDAVLDSDEMKEFREMGATDYLAMALQRSDGAGSIDVPLQPIRKAAFPTPRWTGFVSSNPISASWLKYMARRV